MFDNKLLLRVFPFLAWFPVNSLILRGDLIAGITGALVLVPKAMAYAQLSGLPVYFGLYVAFIPAHPGRLVGILAAAVHRPGGHRLPDDGGRHHAAGGALLRGIHRPGTAAGPDGGPDPVHPGRGQAGHHRQLRLPSGDPRLHERGGHHHRPVAARYAARHPQGTQRFLPVRHLGDVRLSAADPSADAGHVGLRAGTDAGAEEDPVLVQAQRADRRGGHHPRQRGIRFRTQDQGHTRRTSPTPPRRNWSLRMPQTDEQIPGA